jgi:predicted Zn finger-like uncharacterized protein
MIIACPACATRYVVPDSAIGVDGRTVRCAKCRHSWFQDGPELAVPPAPTAFSLDQAEPPESPPAPAPTAAHAEPAAPLAKPEPFYTEPTVPEAIVPEPIVPDAGEPETSAADWDQPHPAQTSQTPAVAPPSEPEPEPQPPISFAADEVPPPSPTPAPLPISAPEADDEYSRFAYEPLFRPRRNPARMWTIAAVLFAVVALGAVAATAWFGLPGWMPFAHNLFAEDQPGLTLDFPAKMQGQRPLSDQTWFFEANGTVTNVSQSARSVPTILAVLKDARGRIVFTAELHSPKRVLAPGESVSINEALVSVPKAATKAEFGWKPGS